MNAGCVMQGRVIPTPGIRIHGRKLVATLVMLEIRIRNQSVNFLKYIGYYTAVPLKLWEIWSIILVAEVGWKMANGPLLLLRSINA